MTNICPFCDSDQAFRYVYEADLFRVIYPKSPACDYHLLIVPKAHYQTVDELPETSFIELGQIIKRLSGLAKTKLGDQYIGYNLLSNNGGESVNQRVGHCHIHVFLRTKLDKTDPIKSNHSLPKDLSPDQIKRLESIKTWFN